MSVLRGIPPRTMSQVARQLARGGLPGGGPAATRGAASTVRSPPPEASVSPWRKPREWRYQTRPSFKRVRGPLVDVFREAEEVLIVVDLGGFTRGEISLSMTPEHYAIRAVRGEQRFDEVIDLPANVDVEHARERLVNGVLEIVLPTKQAPGARGGSRPRAARRR